MQWSLGSSYEFNARGDNFQRMMQFKLPFDVAKAIKFKFISELNRTSVFVRYIISHFINTAIHIAEQRIFKTKKKTESSYSLYITAIIVLSVQITAHNPLRITVLRFSFSPPQIAILLCIILSVKMED